MWCNYKLRGGCRALYFLSCCYPHSIAGSLGPSPSWLLDTLKNSADSCGWVHSELLVTSVDDLSKQLKRWFLETFKPKSAVTAPSSLLSANQNLEFSQSTILIGRAESGLSLEGFKSFQFWIRRSFATRE